VGKIYNVLTYRMAEEIYGSVSGLKEVYVWLLSQIGRPINEPKIVSAQLVLESNASMKEIIGPVEETIQVQLDKLDDFCMELVYGKMKLC